MKERDIVNQGTSRRGYRSPFQILCDSVIHYPEMLCTDDDNVIIPYALSKCEKRFLVKWLTDVRGYDREIIVMFSNRSAHVRSFSDEEIEERPAQKRMKN